jgi:hypothetical protein
VAAVVAAVLVAVGTLAGAGLSPDSVSYVSAARSFASGQGLQVFSGDPLTDWPPLYPLLLSVFGFFGIDAVPASRVVALLTHGALAYLGGRWLLDRAGSRRVAWAGVTALVMAPALFWTAVWAWSEGLFMVLTLACLPGLTRYSGIAVIGTGALYLLWTGRQRWGVALSRCLVFVGIASTPLVLWMLRNRALGEGIMGERSPGHWSLGFNVQRTASLVSTWVVPAALYGFWMLGAAVLMVGLLGVAAWLILRARRSLVDPQTDAGGPAPRSAPPLLVQRSQGSGAGLLSLYVALYLALIVYSASTVALDVVSERLLAPAFPPFALGVVLLFDRVAAPHGGGTKRLRRVLGAAFAVWFVLAFQGTAQILGAGSGGLGYQSPAWRNSDIVAYLRSTEFQGLLRSNDAAGVYLETGSPVEWGPRRHVYASPESLVDDVTPLLEARARGETITLIWFNYAPPYLMSRAEVERALPIGSVGVFDGGVVMRVR